MNISEATEKALHEGKCIARASARIGGNRNAFELRKHQIIEVGPNVTRTMSFSPTLDDLTALDWIVVDKEGSHENL